MDGGLGIRQVTARFTRHRSRSTVVVCDDFAARGANFSRQRSIEVVAVRNAVRPDQDLTRALIAEIARGPLGAKMRSQLAAWHPQASRDEIDEAFQEACLRAAGRCRGRTEGEVFTWLRTTTHRELWLMKRRVRREVLVDITAGKFARAAVDAAPEQLLLDKAGDAEVASMAGVCSLTIPSSWYGAYNGRNRRDRTLRSQPPPPLAVGPDQVVSRVMGGRRRSCVRRDDPRSVGACCTPAGASQAKFVGGSASRARAPTGVRPPEEIYGGCSALRRPAAGPVRTAGRLGGRR
jgi:hypothetical protein